MERLFIILILVGLTNLSHGQIFECLDYQDAVKEGTRSRDGKPGPNYWQNQAFYDMQVEVLPGQNRLKGIASITYQNNSPDTLCSITFRLYQNIYKKGTTRNIPVALEDLHDGIVLQHLTIDDIHYIKDQQEKLPAKLNLEGTNLNVNINRHILPGESAAIEVTWSFNIPAFTQTRRMGKFKDGAYFIGLWYPQIAVYDDIIGWDNQVSHLGIQDFYNDFNDYEIEIKTPENYLVWATGQLQDPETIYTPEILSRLEQAQNSDEIIQIISQEDYTKPLVKSNVWRYKADHVTDFAFGMATNFNWEGSSLLVGGNENRRVLLDMVYHPENLDFKGKTALAKQSVTYFSRQLPGYPFPFSHGTIFNGLPTNGMAVEYPMIANMSLFEDEIFFKSMIAHKLFHNYFPFYMGINEKNCIWMDEGWAFYLTNKFLPENYLPYSVTEIYNKYVGRAKDVPLIASSSYVIQNNLPTQYFLKPFMAYHLLNVLLGEQQFNKVLKEYIAVWHGKHPTPYDFFYLVENQMGQDLSWLWNPLFFEFGYPDLAITKVKDHQVTIEKKGIVPVPVYCEVIYKDNSRDVIQKGIDVWKDKPEFIVLDADPGKSIKKVILGQEDIPDVNQENNIYQVQELYPHFESSK
ncbi:MAG: M1 family metallopeptidase [Candidatus Cyclobacteriaceae bacterium M3_2C_046]